ncbi:hypothetical protein AL755_09980 [Arthrobacter sp. ERGS1:01]|uniref:hypothetical protein n=1 Tax=Arthrobacter sp. ERGS1:01 TaxID=1704044 RepID=UPI0006B62729|nr:hypothetical protein [Arthrobacter sp. ERGS1:01]ALE05720.1 hypothetical protein AL755_09980 [Arthrobacter sp. ERGS1:01]
MSITNESGNKVPAHALAATAPMRGGDAGIAGLAVAVGTWLADWGSAGAARRHVAVELRRERTVAAILWRRQQGEEMNRRDLEACRMYFYGR